MVSESKVSNTELSEISCPHPVGGKELSEFLSASYLCATTNSPNCWQNSPSLAQNSVSSLFQNSTIRHKNRSHPQTFYSKYVLITVTRFEIFRIKIARYLLHLCELCDITRLGPLSLLNYFFYRCPVWNFPNELGNVFVTNGSLTGRFPCLRGPFPTWMGRFPGCLNGPFSSKWTHSHSEPFFWTLWMLQPALQDKKPCRNSTPRHRTNTCRNKNLGELIFALCPIHAGPAFALVRIQENIFEELFSSYFTYLGGSSFRCKYMPHLYSHPREYRNVFLGNSKAASSWRA